MKQLIRIILLALMTVTAVAPASAREFGEYPERARTKCTVTPGKKLNVRSKPSTKGTLIYQLRPGDVVYVEDADTIMADGYAWIQVRDKWGQGLPQNGYVTNLNRFSPEPNPLYNPPTVEEKKIEDAVESSQVWIKWVLFSLAIIAALLMLLAYFSKDFVKKMIGGRQENGLRRTFFFNPEPYKTIIYITLMLMAALLISVLIMLIVGGAAFLLLWLVKILCYVVMWVGIIGCILGIIGCICGAWGCIVIVIIGGIIWIYDDEITAFGDACAATGLEFFNKFNMIGYAWDLCVQYWEPALMIVCAPLALFLAMAIVWLTFAGILILIEKIMTKRYSVKHPCPHCQQNSEPAVYESKDGDGYHELPVRLLPGVYGIFHITHPTTQEKMPTMLLNGRDKLPRLCCNCGKRIHADEGTELHLAMVGTAQSGKSTLTYRLIAELYDRAGSDKVAFTDKGTIKDRNIFKNVESIRRKGRIDPDDLPAKTRTTDTASTQLIVKRKYSPLPYRLYINDVGGELFNPENKEQSANSGRYFHNVDSIILMMDPMTTDLSEGDMSSSFKKTLGKLVSEDIVKLKIRDLQDTVENQILTHGNNPKNIHLNIVLPKIDLCYIPRDVDKTSQESLRDFVIGEMGLGDLMQWGKKFASCTILVVGAMSEREDSFIEPLFNEIMVNQLGMRL